jgi:hypothetical protein
MGVSLGVLGRRVPGPIVFLSVREGRVLMAVRHESVHFADIVVVQFQFQYTELDYESLDAVFESCARAKGRK